MSFTLHSRHIQLNMHTPKHQHQHQQQQQKQNKYIVNSELKPQNDGNKRWDRWSKNKKEPDIKPYSVSA